ncbi:MAG: hypothetical protein Q611_LSC00004G0001, partial [Leuconostoc sp. DORA_2]
EPSPAKVVQVLSMDSNLWDGVGNLGQ